MLNLYFSSLPDGTEVQIQESSWIVRLISFIAFLIVSMAVLGFIAIWKFPTV